MRDLLVWIAEKAVADDVQQHSPLLQMIFKILHWRFETFVEDWLPFVIRME